MGDGSVRNLGSCERLWVWKVDKSHWPVAFRLGPETEETHEFGFSKEHSRRSQASQECGLPRKGLEVGIQQGVRIESHRDEFELSVVTYTLCALGRLLCTSDASSIDRVLVFTLLCQIMLCIQCSQHSACHMVSDQQILAVIINTRRLIIIQMRTKGLEQKQGKLEKK